MPIVEMPNGDRVQFPDDMPKEQIRSMIATKFPELQNTQPAAASADPWERASILPMAKNRETGQVSMAMPGILKSIGDAVSLPGRVYSGETQMRGPDGQITDDVIKQSLDLAGVATPMSAASRVSKIPAAATATPRPTPGQSVALAGERLGVRIPRAVTSDRVSIQQAGKIATNVPIGGTPLRKAATNAIDDLGAAATRAQEGYGTGSVSVAGGQVRSGISDFAKVKIPEQVSKRYTAVDSLVDPAIKTPLSATQAASRKINTTRANAAIAGKSNAVAQIEDAIARPEGLTYEGIKNLRTSIGEMLKKPNLMPANTSEAELKGIYAALSDDLRNAVRTAGGEKAAAAFERANAFKAKTASQVEALNKIVGASSDEALSSKLLAMAGEYRAG
jgi:hypothetical protein